MTRRRVSRGIRNVTNPGDVKRGALTRVDVAAVPVVAVVRAALVVVEVVECHAEAAAPAPPVAFAGPPEIKD